MKIYMTKYALTQGIIESDAELKPEYDNKNGRAVRTIGKYPMLLWEPDWHEELLQAKGRAIQMRIKKQANLRKQIEKLEKLKF